MTVKNATISGLKPAMYSDRKIASRYVRKPPPGPFDCIAGRGVQNRWTEWRYVATVELPIQEGHWHEHCRRYGCAGTY